MRLRDVLPHANFVASAMEMSDQQLEWSSVRSRSIHSLIQGHETTLIPADVGWDIGPDLDDWQHHTTALMLLRDCLGREMTRRGLTPPAPPMLARNWESGGIYECVRSRDIPLPDWLVERGRRELATGTVGAYTGTETEER